MVRRESGLTEMTIQQALDLALQHHGSGRLVEAESLYRQILAVQPNHAEAMHHLGIIAHQAGRSELAIQLIRQALVLSPHHAAAHSNMGAILQTMGRLDEAVAAYRSAIAINPNHAEAYNNLGFVLRERKEREESVAACRRAIELKPDYTEAYNNLGNVLTELGRIDEAMAALAQALRLKPNYPEAHYNLGIALREKGRLENAVNAYRNALELKPDFAKAHINLGNALTELGRFDEAMVSLERARELQPNNAQPYYNLGIALQLRGRPDEAAAAYRRAAELDPHFAEPHNNLGHVLAAVGQTREAITEYRRALALQPGSATTLSNIIFTYHLLPGPDSESIAIDEQRLWNRRFGDPARCFILPHSNDRKSERRLRIGYVSTDFRDHVAGRNLRPLFINHDHQNFEIFCYSGVLKPDDSTAEFRRQSDQWRNISSISDEALAGTIRGDCIDILVDLAQHTADNRLPVFARKPAPLQLSFAAYPGSTGVEAIGYRISDSWLEEKGKMQDDREHGDDPASSHLPPASGAFFIDSFWCYDPCEIVLPVNALPAREKGYVTFGSLNNFSKINEPLLQLWAQILAILPDSRLAMLTVPGSHRQRTVAILEREGVAPSRVQFFPPLPRREYMELYHRLDLVLDTFPYNGHTTSLDALWMGVPVVSLVGSHPVSRAGLSQLSHLGLSDLAVSHEDDYVRIAVKLAHDLSRLNELRSTLRSRMEGSVLMDGPNFARQIESVYRTMWRNWCNSTPNA
jgi:predicted O-linked N-acetylglucosamine transferase (SPINDLY family)